MRSGGRSKSKSDSEYMMFNWLGKSRQINAASFTIEA
jgi:hypothetical protein